jgi:hypothetical protein
MDILYIMEHSGTSSIWLVADLDKWLGFSELKEKGARNNVLAPFYRQGILRCTPSRRCKFYPFKSNLHTLRPCVAA